ncbi:hypothetical protein BGX30_009334, partial [Mortierella sp. GBA39]
CGQRKIWLDPNEVTEIANANSRKSRPTDKSFFLAELAGQQSGRTTFRSATSNWTSK